MFSRIASAVSWQDNPVVLIGGGPSLRGFDFSSIPFYAIFVGINDCAFKVPRCHALVSMDKVWMKNRRKEIRSFPGASFLAVNKEHGIEKKVYGSRSQIVEWGLDGEGLSDNPRQLFGRHGGHAALNLAYLKAAREIYLLGFDLKPDSKGFHWHEGYSWHKTCQQSLYDSWADSFSKCLPKLREKGVKVFNCCPDSRITCFPRISLENFLERKR